MTGVRKETVSSKGWRVWGVIAALALAELVYLGWFLVVPLPNVKNLGHAIGRWIFLAQALPEVVPDLTFEQSHLGHVIQELSHFEYLPQRLPIVLAAALIAGAAMALGQFVLAGLGLRRVLSTTERVPLAYLVGTSGLGVLTLLLGRVGLLTPWVVRIGLGLIAVAGGVGVFWLRERSRGGTNDLKGRSRWSRGAVLGFVLINGPFLLVMALGAMLPTVDYDAIEYHLQGPKEYYQAGRIAFLPHNVYTNMPFDIEMLHLLGMEVLDDWWWGALVGQLLVAGFAPASAALVMLTAGRFGSPRAAWVAGMVYLTTPWVYRLAELPYVEGPLCAYHAGLIFMVGRALTEADPRNRIRLWSLLGLLAGGAMGCKYPALISAVLPCGGLSVVEAVRRRSGWLVPAYIIGWSLIMTPWLVRNLVDTGNPVYPLGYTVFGGRDWDPAREAQWTSAHGPRPIDVASLVDSVLDIAGRSDWHSPLYAMLALLSLLRRESRRPALWLWGYVIYLFGTWWLLTHRLDRFWLPLLPALAVLAGLGADWTRRQSWVWVLGGLLSIATLYNFTFVSTALAGLNEWTGDLHELRTQVPLMTNPALARLDETLPADARVLLVGQAAVFHLSHPVVYNTVFNKETIETLARGKSPIEVRQALRSRGITHVYVDWFEVERFRSPGNYGFTPFVTPELFSGLVEAGVLEPPRKIGERQDLYRVRLL